VSSWGGSTRSFAVSYGAGAAAVQPAWAILDDFFPNLLTGFRIAEYNAYLERFPGLAIYSAQPDFQATAAQYALRYPTHAKRIAPFRPERLAGIRFAYLNFLNNAFHFLPVLEHYRIPFVLTLYPGGGFRLGATESDAKLKRVCASPQLAHVIVTQRATGEYLATASPATAQTLVFGCVVNPLYFSGPALAHPRYGFDKDTFDVCFVAEKYTEHGRNKGYPEFIDAARAVADALPHARFHVVGGCGPDDWPLGAAAERTRFYGRLETTDLRAFFHGMDVIASPNRLMQWEGGSFDGFPTASCVEASLSGVAMVVTDELASNAGRYRPGEELLIVRPEASDVAAALLELGRSPDRLRALSLAGESRTRELFSSAAQIEPRIRVFEQAAAARGILLQQ